MQPDPPPDFDERTLIKLWFYLMKGVGSYIPYDEFLSQPMVVWLLLADEIKEFNEELSEKYGRKRY